MVRRRGPYDAGFELHRQITTAAARDPPRVRKHLTYRNSPRLSRLPPDDIADAVLFLTKNTYVTGITLTVDSGRLLI
jgi:NAD(P)-dependent dehydrogenase (short-subunit alcohol dehydrogenase family)